MARPKTSILPDGDIESRATAIYGSGDVLLRIGNGGAGATGLIEALANDYLSTLPEPRSIAWVCNHSRNSQLALYHDYVDLALTYERDQEALAESEGWSVTAACVFHDHFCLAGPLDDPADIRSSTSLPNALFKIARSQKLFHSRADGSATMWKERSLWSLAQLKPWGNNPDAIWYKTSHVSPAEALQAADADGAYLLTDRSTVLAQTRLKTISNTTVFVEPQGPDDVLMNSCYALLSPFSNTDRFKAAEAFVKYMLSPRGQNVIESYGRAQVGLPLFAPVHSGFATAKLARGAPDAGRWTGRSKL